MSVRLSARNSVRPFLDTDFRTFTLTLCVWRVPVLDLQGLTRSQMDFYFGVVRMIYLRDITFLMCNLVVPKGPIVLERGRERMMEKGATLKISCRPFVCLFVCLIFGVFLTSGLCVW